MMLKGYMSCLEKTKPFNRHPREDEQVDEQFTWEELLYLDTNMEDSERYICT